MLYGFRSDLSAATRSLLRNPVFSGAALLCLALGIGATTAVFSVVNAFLLRPLPFEEPERLISIWMTVHGADEDTRYFVAAPEFTELQEISEGFEIAGVQPVDLNLSVTGEPGHIQGFYATANLFHVLGVPLPLGRPFTLDEERLEEAVCVISEELWRDRLGSRPDVLETALHLNGVRHLITGVAPATAFPDEAHVWIPVTAAVRQGRTGLTAVARLRDGVSLETAVEELQRSAAWLQEKDPVSNAARGLAAGGLNESINNPRLDETLWALLGVVGFLLAIACANVASLLLVRLQRQQPELAVQAALGAGRLRLLRRVLVESGLLAVGGAALGIGLAAASTPALVAMSPAELPRFREIGVDARVLAFALAVSAATLVVFSVLPAWRVISRDPAARLGSAGRGSSRALSRFQRSLAVVDVAMAVVLVAGAGLMLGSFSRLVHTSPGFEPAGLFRARMVAPDTLAETDEGRADFVARVESQLAALPGVAAVGSSHSFPLGNFQYWISFLLEERPHQSPDEPELGMFQVVTPGYFEVLGLRPVRGRLIEPGDLDGRKRVVVISEAFARHYWPQADPLGRRLKPARSSGDEAWFEIVGVVPDQKDRGLAEPIGPSMFFPQPQFNRRYTARMDLFVRSDEALEGMATTIARGIRRVEANAIVHEVTPLTGVLSDSLQRERFSAVLTGILALLALTLAGAGIYGVIAYAVGQRGPEMGVRMAFGARSADLKRLVVAQSLGGVVVGIVLGNGAVVGLGRLVSGQLYETAAYDPATLMGASVLIVVVASLASYLPARRAARLDPVKALRQ